MWNVCTSTYTIPYPHHPTIKTAASSKAELQPGTVHLRLLHPAVELWAVLHPPPAISVDWASSGAPLTYPVWQHVSSTWTPDRSCSPRGAELLQCWTATPWKRWVPRSSFGNYKRKRLYSQTLLTTLFLLRVKGVPDGSNNPPRGGEIAGVQQHQVGQQQLVSTLWKEKKWVTCPPRHTIYAYSLLLAES